MLTESERRFTQLIVIGSSAGGIEALSMLVSALPADFPAPIVVAQHISPHRVSSLGDILSRRTTLPVETITSVTPLKPGVIYVVPPNRDVSITDHEVRVHEEDGAGPRPSVDLLFRSAAEIFREELIAVVLSGTGSDGAAGALEVKHLGGTVVTPIHAFLPCQRYVAPWPGRGAIVPEERFSVRLASSLLRSRRPGPPPGSTRRPLRQSTIKQARRTMGKISTRLHGVLDYTVGLGLIASPRLLRFDAHPRAALVPVAMGASALVYSLLTDYELGALRIIPMPAHLLLDAANGLFLASSPWLLGFADTVWAPHLALGVLELLVVVLSEHHPDADPLHGQVSRTGG